MTMAYDDNEAITQKWLSDTGWQANAFSFFRTSALQGVPTLVYFPGDGVYVSGSDKCMARVTTRGKLKKLIAAIEGR